MMDEKRANPAAPNKPPFTPARRPIKPPVIPPARVPFFQSDFARYCGDRCNASVTKMNQMNRSRDSRSLMITYTFNGTFNGREDEAEHAKVLGVT